MSANVTIPSRAGHAPEQNATTREGGATGEGRRFLTNGLVFVLVSVLIYLAAYAVSEQLNYNYTQRNRFLVIKTAPEAKYDYAILGASHAVVFEFEDMNARLEKMSGSKIINLATVGAGVVPNRFLLDYFLTQHETANIVYVVDSFAFYGRAWNEERLQDTALYQRAPFDPALALMLLNNPDTRSVALDYSVGFSKINNPDRFKTDIGDDEATRFARTYRPLKQIDNQRLAYLYPSQPDPRVMARYMSEFESLLNLAQARGIRVIVVKPPVPERWYKMLPNEAQFDQSLSALLERYKVEFHDYSLVSNAEKYFYNTDHLNREGVLNFYTEYFAAIFKPTATLQGAVP